MRSVILLWSPVARAPNGGWSEGHFANLSRAFDGQLPGRKLGERPQPNCLRYEASLRPGGADVYSIDVFLNCLRSVGAKDRLHISLPRSKSQFQEVGF